MKAAVVTAPGQTPVYADFASPVLAEGQQLITMRAAAVSNLAKARAMGSHYSSDNAYPAVAGVDGVGTTEDGRRVYFALPDAPYGALAELCPASPRRMIPVPDSLDDVTAAAIANPGMSAWAALVERAHLREGETVLVNGATGSAGRLAVQLAKYLGAGKVIATGRNLMELAALKPLGADVVIPLGAGDDYEDALVETFSSGIHVVVDYLWGESAQTAIIAVAKAVEDATPVRFVNVGSVQQPEIALPSAALRSSAIQLMGSGLKSVPLEALLRAVDSVFKAAGPAGLQIATKVLPLATVEQAWREDTGKPRLVITI